MKHLVLGNWKSYGSRQLVADFLPAFGDFEVQDDLWVGLALPFHLLHARASLSTLKLGAQNVSAYGEGAFTGEIHAGMLVESNMDFCLVGHSERRQFFGESVEDTGLKLARLLAARILPVFCIGETLAQRQSGQLRHVLATQLGALDALDRSAHPVIAYEPVWAIGTGVAATPADAREAHMLVKEMLAEKGFGDLPVLYGGSVKPGNAAELAAIPQINGFLVGGASLKGDGFRQIYDHYAAHGR